jgi:hypothetical protein
MRHTFDARAFINDHFGSVAGVVAYVKSWGLEPPNEHAVSKWTLRGQISATWLPLLLVLLELDGRDTVSLAKYVTLPVGVRNA